MAAVNIKVNSDFATASKDLKQFGTVTDAVTKELKDFQNSFDPKRIDEFIDRNRRAAAAVKATDGSLKGAQQESRNLRKEIQTLIKSGIDPQDESIQKLTDRYQELEVEIEQGKAAQKKYSAQMRQTTKDQDDLNKQVEEFIDKAAKGAIMALQGIAVAAVGAGTAIVASTVDLAKYGDELAKTSAKIGVNVESLQELSFAAERSGLSSDALGDIFAKLNKNVGDLQAGTGSLTTLLNKSNPVLAEQLKVAEDSEQAFNLLIKAIENAPTEFEKASLAQAAFGRSGQDIINFANQGSEEIQRLREEAQNYGVVSEETARKSEAFIDSQRNVEQALTGVRAEIAGQLLPSLTDIQNGFANFLTDGDRLKTILEVVGLALAGVTAGFITFLAITKGGAAISAVVTAFKLLNAAIAANPIGAIAVIIATVLVPAIILLIKNWDAVVIIFQTTIADIQQKFKFFASAITTAWTIAINGLKILFFKLSAVIVEKVLGGVSKFLDLASKIPFVGKLFEDAKNFVDNLGESYQQLAEDAEQQSIVAIEAAKNRNEAIQEETREAIQAIQQQKEERLAALKEQEDANAQAQEQIKNTTIETNNETIKYERSAFNIREQLERNYSNNRVQEAIGANEKIVNDTESTTGKLEIIWTDFANSVLGGFNQLFSALSDLQRANTDEQLKLVDKELQARLQAAGVAKKTEIERLQDELQAAKESGDQKNITEATNALKRAEIEQEFEKKRAKIQYKAALSQWKIQRLQALATGAQAIISGLATQPFVPAGIAAGTLATTLTGAQIAAINKSKPEAPTFQTGTGFTPFRVPNNPNNSTADSQSINVNPGEELRITPRGQSGNSQRIIVEIGKQVLFDVMQEGIDSQEVRISADNIQGGIAI